MSLTNNRWDLTTTTTTTTTTNNNNNNKTEKLGLHMKQPVKQDVGHDARPFPTSRWRCHWSLVGAGETEDAPGLS